MGSHATKMEPDRMRDIMRYIHPEVKEYVVELESKLTNLLKFEKEYKEVNEKYVSLQEDLRKMRVQNQELTTKTINLLKLEQELKEVNEKYVSLQEDLRKMGVQNRELEYHREDHKIENHRLHVEIANLKGEIVNLQNIQQNRSQSVVSDQEFETKYLDLQNDLFGIQVQNHEYKSQLKEVTQENERLRKINSKLNKENENLQNSQGKSVGGILKENKLPTEAAAKNSFAPADAETINNANRVLVTSFPKQLFVDNATKSIILLAENMQFPLSEEVIRTVTKENKFYKRQYMKPNKFILIVEFRKLETKVQFLKHRKHLKDNESYKDIEIDDYISEDVNNLCQKAKILKYVGYKSVYCKNNSVYAHKPRAGNIGPRTILIKSQDDVDALMPASD